MALSTLSSCSVESGYRPALNSVEALLFDNVTRSIDNPIDESKYIFYADALLRGSNAEVEQLKSKRLFGVTATVDGTRVFIARNGSNDVYTVVTDGTALAEGGVWQLLTNDGKEGVQRLLYTYTGVVGSPRTVSTLVEANKSTHNLTIQTVQSENNLYFQVLGSGDILGYDYELHYTIKQDAPFCYDYNTRAPYCGEVEIDYRDLNRNTSHHVLFDAKNDIDNPYHYYY